MIINGESIPYLVAKPQKGGSVLHYWQPSKSLARLGFVTVPLGKDETAAITQAKMLNAMVAERKGGQPVLAQNRHGTLPWLVEQYKRDPKYTELRDSTKPAYEYYLREILKWSAEKGDPPMRTIRRTDAKDFWRRWGGKEQIRTASHMVACCSLLWNFALDELEDHDVVDKNPFRRLGFKPPKPRQVVWEPGQIRAVIEAALVTPAYGHGGAKRAPRPVGYRKSIADAVMIIHNTTLRECDVLALMESQYDGEKITCTPSKTRDSTGVILHIPVTPELKAWLDEMLDERRNGKVVSLHQEDRPLIINEATGRRYRKGAFQKWFKILREAAGLPEHLWFEDLRRSAVVQLAEAGSSNSEIAAFTGWSDNSISAMLKIYRPTNIKMAEAGAAKLVEYRTRLKAQSEG